MKKLHELNYDELKELLKVKKQQYKNKESWYIEMIEEELDKKNDELEKFIGVPIWWRDDSIPYHMERNYEVEFIGEEVDDGILYDEWRDRWVNLEYAKKNVIKEKDENYVFVDRKGVDYE